jgi:hypothetical protein
VDIFFIKIFSFSYLAWHYSIRKSAEPGLWKLTGAAIIIR